MDKEELIGRKVNIFTNRINRKINKEVAKYGITGIQSMVLGFVYHKSQNRDVFQKDIEEVFDIRRSSVTSVLQLMEKNGYVERVSVSEDARLKKIILTKKGLEIQKKVHESIIKIEKYLRDELSDDEMYILIHLLDRLSKKIAD
ncbi:MarR family transcriptional regulator [Clostridium carboxidivorans P7]|uniref:MarR family winged helix-turn-helix transcriptional regulator n=1 Tax=Clostridium carboxidivorans TaxID=217159 RepID=UPI0001D39465|nr:MarR family transcriptional regulator [Clostridium carboxidivorans]AKN30921.1 MarR family transcriptional regulator [Clostridium carboxidivorans P7]EFG88827.1 transcriptional regulator, MarR family [Clostridium carboxidivorans P7]